MVTHHATLVHHEKVESVAVKNALIRKLHLNLKRGGRARVLNAPEGYLESVGKLPFGVEWTDANSPPLEFVQVFVADHAQLEHALGQVFHLVKSDGVLWICYLKGAVRTPHNLSRDTLWKAVSEGYGWEGVTLVSIDRQWTAMRFRPKVAGTDAKDKLEGEPVAK